MKNAIVITVGVALVSTDVRAQSFNIDFGPALSPAPSAAYAGAGHAGQWINIPGTQGVNVFNLVDVDGLVTNAWFSQIGGTETLLFNDPSVVGEDSRLMSDALITHSVIESCLFFHDMEPGTYEVTIYAWMPLQPGTLSQTNVDEEPGNPHHLVGGAWPGAHGEFVTYALHLAEVQDGGPLLLQAHSGVPAGGDFGVGAALNGIQIRKVDAIVGDVDGDGDVDINDFLQLLAAWGPCFGCPEDLDGDDLVGINDFLLLLANWT